MSDLIWASTGRHEWTAPDGDGGHYHVERFLRTWLLVHTTAKGETRPVPWLPEVSHAAETGQRSCQEDQNRRHPDVPVPVVSLYRPVRREGC